MKRERVGSFMAVIFLLLALLLLHTLMYYPYMPDDAFISFQYAKRLASRNGFVWTDYNQRPVEGFSNLLWVLILSCASYFRFDLVESARFLGILTSFGTIVTLLTVKQSSSSFNPLHNLVGALVLVSCGVFACWSIGGLEQALLSFLLALSLVFCYPLVDSTVDQERNIRSNSLLASACFSLLAITRPDAPLFGCVAGAVIAFLRYRNYSSIKPGLRIICWTIITTLAITIFRLMYFGDWIPNTAHVKLAVTSHYLWQGLRYINHGLMLHIVPLGLVIVACFFYKQLFNKNQFILNLSILASWLSYLVLMGGDINPPSRHFMPIIVILALCINQAFYSLVLVNERRSPGTLMIWGLPLLLFHLFLQIIEPELKHTRAPRDFFIDDNIAVAKTLKKAFSHSDPLMAVDGAGILPFYTEFKTIDLLGLNDAKIAKTSPKEFSEREFGHNLVGHELGNVRYVLNAKPDLIIFGSYKGNWKGAFPGGKALRRHPEFKKHYLPILFLVDSPRSSASLYPETIPVKLFIRIDGKLGIKFNHINNTITMSAYLLQPPHPTSLYLHTTDKNLTTPHINHPNTITTITKRANIPLPLSMKACEINKKGKLTITSNPQQLQEDVIISAGEDSTHYVASIMPNDHLILFDVTINNFCSR
jgi:hypothetical protein